MSNPNRFLQADESKTKEAKWNLFKFQDHLLSWISLSSQYFQERDYPNSFESLTNVYTDTYGFFTEEEKKETDDLFKKAREATDAYSGYNINYGMIKRQVRNKTYQPPSDVYFSLIAFRKKLMELMTKYQLLIPQINKSEAGAGQS